MLPGSGIHENGQDLKGLTYSGCQKDGAAFHAALSSDTGKFYRQESLSVSGDKTDRRYGAGHMSGFYMAAVIHGSILGGNVMTAEEHRKFLERDFDDVRLDELKDISKIRIDRDKTVEEKKKQYLSKAGNPYLVKVGNTMVKIRFANNGVSFEDALESLLLMS